MSIMRFLGQAAPGRFSVPLAAQKFINNQMKTDVWALVGIVVTTIQTQQVTH